MTGLAIGIRDLSDVKALERVPLTDRGLPADVLGLIKEGATRSEGRPALVFLPDPSRPRRTFDWSFGRFAEIVEQTARGFAALNDGRAPTVSLLLPNLPETHFALWGGQAAGKANPINPLLEPAKIASIMRAAETGILVTLAPLPGMDLFDKAVAACRDAPTVHTVVTVNPARYGAGAKASLGRFMGRASAPGRRTVSFGRLAELGRGVTLDRPSSGDVAALFHTGGTTGAPKIAQLTHGNQVFVSWAAGANRYMVRHKSLFCGLPLFHVNGALVSGPVTWLGGGTVVLGPPQGFRTPGLTERYWEIVETHRIGAMSAVPTIYRMLLDHPIGGHDVSSLEFGITGAAPMPPTLRVRFEEATGIHLLEGYGGTEGACISTITPGYGEVREGTVGIRLAYQQLAVAQVGDGKAVRLPTGGDGSILIRGPNVFAGYKDPKDDAAAWVRMEGERWYDTGDTGQLDPDGYLRLKGRMKELIIRGGHNIDPAVIEDALAAHPGVGLAAAVPSPDPRIGEVPVAYVTLAPGGTASEADLLDAAARTIAERAAVPRRVFVIDDMPLTAVGKVFKPELRRREAQRVVEEIVSKNGIGCLVEAALDPKGIVSVTVDGTGLDPAAAAALERVLGELTLPIEVRRD